MAGELTITLSEAEYIHTMEQLSKLSKLEEQAAVQKGLQEGVSVIAKEGRKTLKSTLSREPSRIKAREYMAAKRGGSLLRSIGTRTVKKQVKGYAGFRRLGHHAHLVDTGTGERFTKSGYYRGKVLGSKFWRTAFNNKKNEAANQLMESIRKTIQKLGK